MEFQPVLLSRVLWFIYTAIISLIILAVAVKYLIYAERNDIILLDFQKVLSNENGTREKKYAGKDGSHISPKGYKKLAIYIEDELEEYLIQ